MSSSRKTITIYLGYMVVLEKPLQGDIQVAQSKAYANNTDLATSLHKGYKYHQWSRACRLLPRNCVWSPARAASYWCSRTVCGRSRTVCCCAPSSPLPPSLVNFISIIVSAAAASAGDGGFCDAGATTTPYAIIVTAKRLQRASFCAMRSKRVECVKGSSGKCCE